MKNISIEEVKEIHQKLREILQKYGNPEFGDCIVDEISWLFDFPTTADTEVDFDHVQEWFYSHDTEWQSDMENDFYESDNEEGAKSYIEYAYMRYHKGVTILN